MTAKDVLYTPNVERILDLHNCPVGIQYLLKMLSIWCAETWKMKSLKTRTTKAARSFQKIIQDTAWHHNLCNNKLLLLNGPIRKLTHRGLCYYFWSLKLLTNMEHMIFRVMGGIADHSGLCPDHWLNSLWFIHSLFFGLSWWKSLSQQSEKVIPDFSITGHRFQLHWEPQTFPRLKG